MLKIVMFYFFSLTSSTKYLVFIHFVTVLHPITTITCFLACAKERIRDGKRAKEIERKGGQWKKVDRERVKTQTLSTKSHIFVYETK